MNKNKIDRTVTIFIGGKERKMRFNINAIVELESKIPEKNIIALMSKNSFPIETLIIATWIGLKYQDKLLDIKKVKKWVADYLVENSYAKLYALVFGAIGISGLCGNGNISLFQDVIAKANAINEDEPEENEDTDEKN